tara:strand:- start:1225 stop:1599 length:375 start_codon:yes stop_codon:yes gene_type:complete
MDKQLLFTKEHEWIKVDGKTATIGITDYAQSELGDIIFVELPDKDETFESNDVFGTIEAVKTVADLFMPVSSKIVEVNSNIEDSPELINSSPQDDGWIVKISINNMTDLDDLLSIDDYKKMINK